MRCGRLQYYRKFEMQMEVAGMKRMNYENKLER